MIPLRIARGIQTKLLEAMAHGVPVIATHAALDGIAAKPERDLLDADEPHDFAGKTVAVLQDRSMRAQLAANALALVQKDYRWETTLHKLEESISSISLKSNVQTLDVQAVDNLRALRGANLISQAESSSPGTEVRGESDALNDLNGLNQTRTNDQLPQAVQNLRELRVLRGEKIPLVSRVIPAKTNSR